MEKHKDSDMALPQFYDLVRITSQIGAALGCIAGVFYVFGGFKFGFMGGLISIFSGIFMVIFSLTGLGVAYCFLAIVKAQIESRNAIIKYTSEHSAD